MNDQRGITETPASMTVAPLLIVGSPRSGTTLLGHTINRFLNIHIARDAGIFLRFYKGLPWYGDLADPVQMQRLIGDLYRDRLFQTRFINRGLTLSEHELYTRLPELTYRALVRQVFVETARTHGKQHWGNKKPSYALQLSETEAIFPGAKIVHIVRDGRDVVLSMRKASHMLVEKNWYFAACDWRDHVLLARRAGQSLGKERYLEINYENLLANPFDVFQSILTFIQMDFDSEAQRESVRAGLKDRIRSGNYDKWRTQMPDRAIRVVERVAGGLLDELGYQLKFPEVAQRRFNKAQVGFFYIDRAVRNIFTRDSGKFVRAHLNVLTSAGRARVGALRRNKRPSVPAAKPVADRDR